MRERGADHSFPVNTRKYFAIRGTSVAANTPRQPKNTAFLCFGFISMPIIIPKEIRQNFRTAKVFQSLVWM